MGNYLLLQLRMEDPGHFPQRHLVLLGSEKPLQHVLLLRHPCFLLLPPQHQSQHQHFLLKLLPLVPDQNPPGHIEVLGLPPGDVLGGPVAGGWVEGINSGAGAQGGQGLAPVDDWINICYNNN